jgi:hypothetical protein
MVFKIPSNRLNLTVDTRTNNTLTNGWRKIAIALTIRREWFQPITCVS